MDRREFLKAAAASLPLCSAPAVFGSDRRSESIGLAKTLLDRFKKDQSLQEFYLRFVLAPSPNDRHLKVCVGEYRRQGKVVEYRAAISRPFNHTLSYGDCVVSLPPDPSNLPVLEEVARRVVEKIDRSRLEIPSGSDDLVLRDMPSLSVISLLGQPTVVKSPPTFRTSGWESNWWYGDTYMQSLDKWSVTFPIAYFIGTREQAVRLAGKVDQTYGRPIVLDPEKE
jgi:hypothetical protein